MVNIFVKNNNEKWYTIENMKRPMTGKERREDVGHIRYKVDIMQALRNVGISSYKILREGLIPQSTTTKLRRGDTSINLSSVATICHLLHCQPGDLLEYVEDGPEDAQDSQGGASPTNNT